ncbi:hypothetical protein HYS47_01455, partial [Candidatus Woesearchaeota archaeon]|nr:hypothetical protein [Candidatus Woesearchaeota archaeon]
GEDDQERPTAIVSEKRFWHALPFLKPKSREVCLQQNVPFEMRLEEQCMIGVSGTYTLFLSPSPVHEAFRARIRATSYDK